MVPHQFVHPSHMASAANPGFKISNDILHIPSCYAHCISDLPYMKPCTPQYHRRYMPRINHIAQQSTPPEHLSHLNPHQAHIQQDTLSPTSSKNCTTHEQKNTPCVIDYTTRYISHRVIPRRTGSLTLPDRQVSKCRRFESLGITFCYPSGPYRGHQPTPCEEAWAPEGPCNQTARTAISGSVSAEPAHHPTLL